MSVPAPGSHALTIPSDMAEARRVQAEIERALQDATAKIGHIIRNPAGEVTIVQQADRDKAPLIQRGQAGNAIFFGFPELDVSDDALIVDGIETLSERAVKEGREQGNVYKRLKGEIDLSRQMYEQKFPEAARAGADFLREELVRILADGRPEALGM